MPEARSASILARLSTSPRASLLRQVADLGGGDRLPCGPRPAPATDRACFYATSQELLGEALRRSLAYNKRRRCRHRVRLPPSPRTFVSQSPRYLPLWPSANHRARSSRSRNPQRGHQVRSVAEGDTVAWQEEIVSVPRSSFRKQLPQLICMRRRVVQNVQERCGRAVVEVENALI